MSETMGDARPRKRPALFVAVMSAVLVGVAGIAWLISSRTGHFLGIYASLLWLLNAAGTAFNRRGRGWRRVDVVQVGAATLAGVLLGISAILR